MSWFSLSEPNSVHHSPLRSSPNRKCCALPPGTFVARVSGGRASDVYVFVAGGGGSRKSGPTAQLTGVNRNMTLRAARTGLMDSLPISNDRKKAADIESIDNKPPLL